MPDGQIIQQTPTRRRNVMLTAAQESDLLGAWRDGGDADALDRLLRAFEPLCRKLAKRYEGAAERNDLLQEARLGLLDAIRRYDPEHGTRLATYASFWIHERLRRYTTETQPIVRVPRNTRQALSRMLEEAGRDRTAEQAGDSGAVARAVAERHGRATSSRSTPRWRAMTAIARKAGWTNCTIPLPRRSIRWRRRTTPASTPAG